MNNKVRLNKSYEEMETFIERRRDIVKIISDPI